MSEGIKIEGLTKTFGSKKVIDNLTVEIKTGRIVGLLGENGIGKTTLLKLIAGFLQPDRGYIKFIDLARDKNIREHVAMLLEPECFYSWMRIKDAIEFYKDFFIDFKRDKAIQYCEQFNLNLDDKIKKLSKGNKEKVSIILNLCRNVGIYLLDEPTGGFDPRFKKEIIRLILDRMNEKKTIIIASHLLKDMENLFDDILILRKNSLIYKSSDEIRQDFAKSVEEYYLEVQNV